MTDFATNPLRPATDAPAPAPVEETLGRLRPLLPRFGITRVADVTGLDRIGIPVWCAIRPNSWSLAVSQGKGLTPEQAQVSAIMEAVELWHAERVELTTRWERPDRLARGATALDVRTFPDPDPGVCERRIPWVLGTDLVDGSRCWVPRDAVDCDDRIDPHGPRAAVQGGTNGLAAGAIPAQATAHALCEVLERHAVAGWEELGEAERADRRVDLGTVEDPVNRELIALFGEAGVTPVVWDVGSTVGVPVFDCLLVEDDRLALHPMPQVLGTGCHPRPEVALTGALTEAAQVRATIIAGARDSIPRSRYEWYYDPHERRDVASVLGDHPVRQFPIEAGARCSTLEAEVDWLVSRTTDASGARVAAVDLTKATIGIPVVKVVAEGLRWAHALY